MKTDITSVIQSAFSSSPWKPDEFHAYLNSLTDSTEDGIFDWDEFAGENWARVLIQDQPVIYLHRSAPLVFIQKNLQNIIPKVNSLFYITFLDPDDAIYSLDENFFEQWSHGRSKSGELNANSLSVSDIWWATVL